MRSIRRLLALAVAVSGLLVSSASLAAAAEPYPIPPPVVTVDRGTIIVNESVVVSGTGFLGGEPVNVNPLFQGAALAQLGRSAHGSVLAAAPAVATADNNGAFSISIRLDRVGTYVLTVTGGTSGRTGSVTVRVLPPGSELPVTGNDGSYLGIVLVGSAVLIAGAALLTFTRIRRRPSKIES